MEGLVLEWPKIAKKLNFRKQGFQCICGSAEAYYSDSVISNSNIIWHFGPLVGFMQNDFGNIEKALKPSCLKYTVQVYFCIQDMYVPLRPVLPLRY